MDINWKLRLKQPTWWLGVVSIVLSPILTYFGLTYQDLTTWQSLGEIFSQFISNPYLIGVVIVALLGALGVTVDPTTVGISDSVRALSYTEPYDNAKHMKEETIES